MAKIFISHSMKDSAFVEKIYCGLIDNKHEIVTFDSKYSVGDNMSAAIANALKNIDFFIVIVTNNSISSDWVRYEINISKGYYGESGKPKIIPVVIGNVELHGILVNHLAIRIDNEDQIDELIGKLNNVIEIQTGEIIAKRDKRVSIQDNLDRQSKIYIEKSLENLRKTEKRYRYLAYWCYVAAYIPLFISILYTINRDVIKFYELTLGGQIQFVVMGIVIVSLIIATSRFAFILGKSFMVESLRNSERIHAISFGEFYLKTFGTDATWEEIKDAFQNWNIDKGSYFISQAINEYDPELLKSLMTLLRNSKNTKWNDFHIFSNLLYGLNWTVFAVA